MAAPKIEVRGVRKTFRRPGSKPPVSVEVLRDVSFSVQPGEFVCLVGPSGCGKTTLLRLIDGLLAPDQGEIAIDGLGPPKPGPQAGFVFQSFRLLPWRTVLDNVQFPLQIQGMDRQRRLARASEFVALVGLEGFEHSFPHELSGGMQQRVGLARALALEPEILLMDEPFAALDAQTRELMQIELSRIWEARRVAVVFVTHSLDEALFLADRIILLGPRPATVDEVLEVPLQRPRWEYDVRAQVQYVDMRAHLWARIRTMVGGQPEFMPILQGVGAGE
ncbi:MAG TPA: ABC transporter ATP-binding protein [Chloroflexota bacterium]|nr:ABC transporter ATP-binding protein [Chloroflexota bacterium]